MDEKFKYQVNPRIAIKGLTPKPILRATDIELTKDEVKECLKHGPVYRKFDGSHVVRVTLNDVDRLHQKNFISEEDWANTKPVTIIPGKIITPKEEKKEEVKVEEVKVEEKKPATVIPSAEAKEVKVEEKVETTDELNMLPEEDDAFAEDEEDLEAIPEDKQAKDVDAPDKEVKFEKNKYPKNDDHVG